MNRFGEIADELTELIEELEQPGLAAEAAALRAALQRAFGRACEADRARRTKEAGAEPATVAAAPRPRRRATAPARRAEAVAEPRGVVIQWPRAWRGAAVTARRLDD
jgi:hypothetical protein